MPGLEIQTWTPPYGGFEVMGVAEISQGECVESASSMILSLFVFRDCSLGKAEAFCVFVLNAAVRQGGVVRMASKVELGNLC